MWRKSLPNLNSFVIFFIWSFMFSFDRQYGINYKCDKKTWTKINVSGYWNIFLFLRKSNLNNTIMKSKLVR